MKVTKNATETILLTKSPISSQTVNNNKYLGKQSHGQELKVMEIEHDPTGSRPKAG